MKIKHTYIYLIGFVIIVLILVLVTSQERPSRSTPEVKQNSELPNDELHQNLGNAPGSGNVTSDFKKKMENLKSNYELDPSDIENAIEYARLLAAAHKPQDAVVVYKNILNNDSKRNEIRIELATVLFNLQKYEEVKRELEIVLVNDPNSSDVYYNLGAVEAAMGNNSKAKEIWEKLIRDYPNTEAAEFAKQSLSALN